MLHGYDNIEMDTTRDKFLKIHVTCVRYVSDTTWLYDKSVHVA